MRPRRRRPAPAATEDDLAQDATSTKEAAVESDRSRLVDTLLTAVAAASGVALVGAALRDNPRALILIAGLEGSVVIVILGAAIAMLGGLRARVMLALLAPILGLQIAIMMSRAIPWRAPIGIELLGLGLIGFAATQGRAYVRAKLRL